MTLNDLNWDFKTFNYHIIIKLNISWSIIADLTRLTSDIFEIGQFFMSIRNYDSTQTNNRKNLSSPLVRKSNFKIINIFGREILNCGSWRKTLSKRHRPEIGVAAPWELINPFLHKLLEQQLAYPQTPPFPLSVSMKLLKPSPQWEKWDPRATIDPVVSKCKLLYKIKKYYIRNLKCYILSRIKIDYANLYSEEGDSL